MELPIQNLTNISPPLDKSAMDAAAFAGAGDINKDLFETPSPAGAGEVRLAQSEPLGQSVPGGDTLRTDSQDRFANGYAMPRRAEGGDGYEQNIYEFNNAQASGEMRDPEAARMSNPAELITESFQSISYFIDRDMKTQHRLMQSQGHDVSDMPASNPFIVSNTSFTNVSLPTNSDSQGSRDFNTDASVTSGNNNSPTGMVDEQLRGLASFMGDVMLFSYQATLISKVSQSFSSSVSTLMRGQ
ncbi:hypothetical protein GCM10007276_11810 [Agaricicola taiwanensis]|uniref:Uncharacterized protein n=1 Tax=Agaricicola taiwanensis TaxID=591372 RepID=A0A8J2VPH6_9RHOB|nr:hypothetical protein [Agaricicola taiwanensis]GGE35985.1 hypothetical protein GCM10007276_11810 [Agaricicola taiwanensis]